MVARYNTDGSLDNTFGNGGIVTTPVVRDDTAMAVALQQDGKIVVAVSTIRVLEPLNCRKCKLELKHCRRCCSSEKKQYVGAR